MTTLTTDDLISNRQIWRVLQSLREDSVVKLKKPDSGLDTAIMGTLPWLRVAGAGAVVIMAVAMASQAKQWDSPPATTVADINLAMNGRDRHATDFPIAARP